MMIMHPPRRSASFVQRVSAFFRAEEGASAVEFALIVPFFVLPFLLMADVALAVNQQMTMDQINRAAALTAMEGGALAEIQQTLDVLSMGKDFAPTVVCAGPCADPSSPDAFLLKASKPYEGMILNIELTSSLLVQVQ